MLIWLGGFVFVLFFCTILGSLFLFFSFTTSHSFFHHLPLSLFPYFILFFCPPFLSRLSLRFSFTSFFFYLPFCSFFTPLSLFLSLLGSVLFWFFSFTPLFFSFSHGSSISSASLLFLIFRSFLSRHFVIYLVFAPAFPLHPLCLDAVTTEARLTLMLYSNVTVRSIFFTNGTNTPPYVLPFLLLSFSPQVFAFTFFLHLLRNRIVFVTP